MYLLINILILLGREAVVGGYRLRSQVVTCLNIALVIFSAANEIG